MQGAALACLGAIVAVLWLALSQPWLGLKLAPEMAGVRILAAAADGPARLVPAPSVLVAIGPAGGAGRPIGLNPADVIEEPDVIETYALARAFMQRQTAIAELLRQDRVMLEVRAGDTMSRYEVKPASRPLADLPSSFWVQLVTGAGSLLLGAWVMALRPRDLATRLFAVAGTMILVSAYAAAVYSSRELAIDGHLIRLLGALNHLGALGFGAAMISLFLIYPRRLVAARWLIALPAVTAVWFTAHVLHLPSSQAVGAQLPIFLYMLGLAAAVGVQWFASRGDPRARAALRWFGLSVVVGAGAFVALIIVPTLLDAAPLMQQGHAFGFFLLIYAGLGLGVSRYRLFDLDEWAFRVMFYTAGLALLLVIDALLLYIMRLQHDVSFGIALLAVTFIYLPARDTLRARLQARGSVESHELFRAVVDVTFAATAQERSERWRDLLRRLFDPLVMQPCEAAVAEVEIAEEGLAVWLPAVADTPALLLRYPWRGRWLFGSAHRTLAQQLVRLIRYVEASRDAYERGGLEERRRIARDLHDDVGARLLSGLYKTDVGDTHRVLREALADIRTIVSGLSADQLPLGQVVAALRHETGERLAGAGIALDWPLSVVDDSAQLLDYRIYRSLVSALREAVSNVIRHAQARRVEVTIADDAGTLVARVADDGIGIATRAAGAAGQGSGLRGIVRRLGDLGGAFVILPAASGSTIEIRIPVTPAATEAAAAAPHVRGVSPPGPAPYTSPAAAARRLGEDREPAEDA